MKEEIKVGQVWTSIFDKSEITVLHLTNNSVVYVSNKYENDFIMKFENFHFNFTLKKPEKVLKKLVGWVDKNNKFMGLDFEEESSYGLYQKELIVKDGSLYVDMGEVGE